jgi:hypothetical protein
MNALQTTVDVPFLVVNNASIRLDLFFVRLALPDLLCWVLNCASTLMNVNALLLLLLLMHALHMFTASTQLGLILVHQLVQNLAIFLSMVLVTTLMNASTIHGVLIQIPFINIVQIYLEIMSAYPFVNQAILGTDNHASTLTNALYRIQVVILIKHVSTHKDPTIVYLVPLHPVSFLHRPILLFALM